jgi:hypothetical protein
VPSPQAKKPKLSLKSTSQKNLNKAPQRPALENKLRFVELGQFLFKSIVNNFMLEINAFYDETSTLHKHRLSKPSFDALLNKSKESKFGCLKTTLEKQLSVRSC